MTFKFWLNLLVLFLLTLSVAAQDDAADAYAEALRRIEEARVSGATRLDLSNLGLQELYLVH